MIIYIGLPGQPWDRMVVRWMDDCVCSMSSDIIGKVRYASLLGCLDANLARDGWRRRIFLEHCRIHHHLDSRGKLLSISVQTGKVVRKFMDDVLAWFGTEQRHSLKMIHAEGRKFSSARRPPVAHPPVHLRSSYYTVSKVSTVQGYDWSL